MGTTSKPIQRKMKQKQIFFWMIFLFAGMSLMAQEGEVVNHIFEGNEQASSEVFDEAEMSYRRALSKAPEKPEALYNLGNTHFQGQDFEEAKQRYFQTQKFAENKSSKHYAFHNMGNVFMKKCEDVFEASKNFMEKYKLKDDYDFLIVDFHGEITSEKNAIGHYFDGKATLVIGTHTHIPTNDARVLKNGTAYQTDAGMCGDYDSVIGMNKDNSLNRFMKKDSIKHFPAVGEASLSGVIVNCNLETGLADSVESYIFGGLLKNT